MMRSMKAPEIPALLSLSEKLGDHIYFENLTRSPLPERERRVPRSSHSDDYTLSWPINNNKKLEKSVTLNIEDLEDDNQEDYIISTYFI